MTITVYDAGISGGSKPESYVVQSTDNLNSIAAGLAGVISGDSTLSALGISASSSSAVVNLSSMSHNLTTYIKSTSTGATETITLAQSTGITAFSFNNLNELTSTSGGGVARFQGTTSKPIVSATIDSTVHANLPNSTSFTAQPSLSTGSNLSTVNVVDGNNNSVTNTYQIAVQSGPSATLNYDANGNMTSDESSYCLPLWDMVGRDEGNADSELTFVSSGEKVILRMGDLTHRESRSRETQAASQDLPYMRISSLSRGKLALLPASGSGCTNTFSFDAENRLIKITYPGTNNFSTFVYDGLGRNVSIVETTAGSVTSTKNFVWSNEDERTEERDGSGSVTKQFFGRGQKNATTKYFYSSQQISSITEMNDNSGVLISDRTYDPYGRAIVNIESVTPDFGFGGYYLHPRSGLNLTMFRAYGPSNGRWLSRDPLAEPRRGRPTLQTLSGEDFGSPRMVTTSADWGMAIGSAAIASRGVNLYAYVCGNPVNLNDRSGLAPWGQCNQICKQARDAAYKVCRDEHNTPFNCWVKAQCTYAACMATCLAIPTPKSGETPCPTGDCP